MNYCYVDTAFGKVKGIVEEKRKLYRSIPYAITERFSSPKAVNYWGEYDATAKSRDCIQRFSFSDAEHEKDNFYFNEFYYLRNSEYVESPMTLTISTPVEKDNCPVIVYLHGGSFENGCIDDLPFGYSSKYPSEGIIVVSVGYRLNVFGLYDSQNYMLKDQLFALRWVKDNIKNFGGNPKHIILMGQSAGAMCISDLLLIKELDELVVGAIMISGAGILPKVVGPQVPAKNHDFWQLVMQTAGCHNYEELLKVDSKVLWQSWHKCKKAVNNKHVLAPSIDGEVIKDEPTKIIKEKGTCNIPLLIGVTSQDMYPYMIYDLGLKIANRHARNNYQPVYGYFFDHNLPGDDYKAFHGSDLWYIFGAMEKSWRPFTDFDRLLNQQVMAYMINFVKNLNPNGDALEYWPAISKTNKKYRWFNNKGKVLISPMNCRMKLYRTWIFEKGPF